MGSYDGGSSWHCSNGLFVDLYIGTVFLHLVYALVPDPSWSFMDAIWRDIGLSCQAVGCSCCKVHGNSRGEFVGDRPPQLIPATHLLRIYGCQQNVSATVVVGKSSHVFFGIENSWFSSPGYRKSIPAFPAMSFKSCATSLHELWTPLLGRSCCANRPWGANVWGVEISPGTLAWQHGLQRFGLPGGGAPERRFGNKTCKETITWVLLKWE